MKTFVAILGVLSLVRGDTYHTIQDDLKGYFANDYDGIEERKSEWTGDTYSSTGMPHYNMTCTGNGNIPLAQDYSLTIPETQESGMYSTPMGPVGYAVNGVPIYNAVDAFKGDAYVNEGKTMDGCGAHSDGVGRYHYHSVPGSPCPSSQGDSSCFPQIELPDVDSDLGTVHLTGVALDGFPIFVTINSGSVIEEDDLDDCGGKVYSTGDNGELYYAYFMFPNFPYSIRCFTGMIPGINNRNKDKLSCAGNSAGDATYLCYRDAGTSVEVQCLPSTETECDTVSCYNTRIKCLSHVPVDAVNAPNWT